MNEILSATIRITTLVFLVSCTSGVGVGVQNFKDPDVPVMIVVTTLTGILILLPAARLIGKCKPPNPQTAT
jgi:hypothetical protein